MAKKRKRSKRVDVLGIRVPRRVVRAGVRALRTPLGKVLLTEALIQAAAMLTARHPTAAAAAVGAGAAEAGKEVAGGVKEAAAKLLSGTAELLKSSVANAGLRKDTSEKAVISESSKNGAHEAGARNGKGSASIWEALDSEMVRDALLGELTRKRKKRSAGGKRR